MSYSPKSPQERVAHRLKIASGHLLKVIQMVEDGQYCIDVIHQSQAVQKALKEADQVLLKYHLEHCVSDQIKNGKSKKAISEVLAVFDKKK